MSTGKTYSTKYLLDSNNNRGSEGQILSTTSTGIDWVDANTVPGTGLWLASGNNIYNSNSGNVGIGTTSPGAKLDVSQTTTGIGAIIGNTTHNSQLQIYTAAAAKNSEIWFGDAADADVGKIDYDHSDNSLNFTVNAAERMRIEADGQVSLRTAGAHLMFQNTVGTAPYIANAGTGYADLTIATGGSERIRITSAGRVEVTGNVLSIDNVDEYRQDFTTTGSSTPSFDIDLKSIGASGQPFEVFVAWTHYSTAYGAGLHQAYYQRSTVQSDITLIHTYFNQTSTNGGAWSVVWLTGTEIRVQKSAGSHAGTGYGYIRVTRLKP